MNSVIKFRFTLKGIYTIPELLKSVESKYTIETDGLTIKIMQLSLEIIVFKYQIYPC